MALALIYQNKWCRIILRDTYYILKSKQGKYPDQYFNSLDAAKKAIGIIPDTERYSFTKNN